MPKGGQDSAAVDTSEMSGVLNPAMSLGLSHPGLIHYPNGSYGLAVRGGRMCGVGYPIS
jgi:hypothetical protein